MSLVNREKSPTLRCNNHKPGNWKIIKIGFAPEIFTSTLKKKKKHKKDLF